MVTFTFTLLVNYKIFVQTNCRNYEQQTPVYNYLCN
jgi:hypothetical protein